MARRAGTPTAHRSFRFPVALVGRLQRKAHDNHESVNALVSRYLDESLRMDEHPHVRFWSRAGGRQAMLQGHRLSVADVVRTVREAGSAEEAARYLDIAAWKVEACLDYFARYTGDIETEIREADDLSDREYEALTRRRQALGS